MSEALVRAKLVRAYQSLQESSNAYDYGCMEIKEILDQFLSEKAVYTKKYTEAELQEKLRQQREACADTYHRTQGMYYTDFTKEKILNAKID